MMRHDQKVCQSTDGDHSTVIWNTVHHAADAYNTWHNITASAPVTFSHDPQQESWERLAIRQLDTVTFSPKGWGEVSSPVFPIWELLRDGGSATPVEEHTTVLLESLPLSGLYPCGKRTTEAMSRKRLWQALKVWNKQWVYFVSTTFISLSASFWQDPYLISFPFHCCINPGLKRWRSR